MVEEEDKEKGDRDGLSHGSIKSTSKCQNTMATVQLLQDEYILGQILKGGGRILQHSNGILNAHLKKKLGGFQKKIYKQKMYIK